MFTLKINNLHVSTNGTPILRGVDLEINEGETIALLGPNGHGKSTLLSAIMGNPSYQINEGSIYLNDQDLLKMSIDERSKAGLFLGMQYPSEIPGLNNADFLKAAINAHQEKPLKLFEYYSKLQNAYKEMDIPFEMSKRNLNEGFSGGEKKRNEILQMRLLNPKIAMLDEIDSGLDVDAMQIVANSIKNQQKQGTGFLIISHYARLYEMVHPTKAVVLVNGKIVTSGGFDLVERIDHEGYEWIHRELGISIEKETNSSMNSVSIGSCLTKEIVNGKK